MEISSKEPNLFYLRLEDVSQLLASCREAGIAVEDLAKLPVKRQREKAAERLLLCRAFGHPVTLCHDSQGAPFVDGMEVNISITHTQQLVALAVDDSLLGRPGNDMGRKVVRSNELFFVGIKELIAHLDNLLPIGLLSIDTDDMVFT